MITSDIHHFYVAKITKILFRENLKVVTFESPIVYVILMIDKSYHVIRL